MALTPIADWDFVPFQRITAPIQIGVVAFSKEIITAVDFTWTDQDGAGSTVTPATVTACTYNSDNGVWEWHATFDPADFTTGPVQLDCTVTGEGAATRVLPTLRVVADDGNTGWQRVKAWVNATTGNDSTGVASPTETGSNPFATCAKAAAAIAAYRNTNYGKNNTDGAWIYLNEAAHLIHDEGVSDLGFDCEWLTITRESGAAKASTTVNGQQYSFPCGLVRWYDISPLSKLSVIEATGRHWMDNCSAVGVGQLNNSIMFYRGAIGYATESTIDTVEDISSIGKFQLIRNCTFSHIGNDAMRHVKTAINLTINDVNPGPYVKDVQVGTLTITGGNTLTVAGTPYDLGDYAFEVGQNLRIWTPGTGYIEGHTIATLSNTVITVTPADLPNGTYTDHEVGETLNHSDGVQYFNGGTSNDVIIHYGVSITDAQGTCMFWRAVGADNLTLAEGIAIVNCVLWKGTLNPGGNAAFMLYRSSSHSVFYHNTVQKFNFYEEGGAGSPTTLPTILGIGNVFNSNNDYSNGPTDITNWHYNHFVGGTAWGDNYVSGSSADLDAATHVPNVGSPVLASVNRLAQVPGDINGNARDLVTAKGAFRGPAEGGWYPARLRGVYAREV